MLQCNVVAIKSLYVLLLGFEERYLTFSLLLAPHRRTIQNILKYIYIFAFADLCQDQD